MEAVTAEFLKALRLPHTIAVRVDAYRRDVNGNNALIARDLPVDSGEVTVDGTAPIRRMLSCSLLPERGLWDTLAPVGTQLHVWRGIRYPAGNVELVRLGRFVIDAQNMSYGPDGRVQITAPDRWAYIQRARFETPRKLTAGRLMTQEIAEFVAGPIPNMSVETMRIEATSQMMTPRGIVYERDRTEAIEDLTRSIGAEAFIAPDGVGVIRDVPELSDKPVWLVDASASGVLISADRERNRQKTRNVVVVTSSKADGSQPFPPEIVADTDPSSPTRVDGPFGRVPHFYASPVFRTPLSMRFAGKKILARLTGLAAQVNLENVVNPALDAGDVIDVLLPASAATNGKRRVERHLIDSLTVPLSVSGTQRIETRSTRPDDVTE